MPITALDADAALLVVDLQAGIAGPPREARLEAAVQTARTLAEAFRARGLTVALITVDGGAPGRTEQAPRRRGPAPPGFTDLLPELGRSADDILVTKKTWGAFAGTDLDARLRARGVTQVVVAGVATATGVESTARQAYEAGFNVAVATDAVADMRPEAHAYSFRYVFPRLGETGTAQEIIEHLSPVRA